MSYSELNERYLRQVDDYESMSQLAIQNRDASRLPAIRAKAQEIAATLNQMVEKLTYMKQETPTLQAQRDNLLQRLRRIQTDYNELMANSDDLETLRRIREQESDAGKLILYQYVGLFLLLAALVLVAMIVFGSQKKEVATAMPSMAASSPALT